MRRRPPRPRQRPSEAPAAGNGLQPRGAGTAGWARAAPSAPRGGLERCLHFFRNTGLPPFH